MKYLPTRLRVLLFVFCLVLGYSFSYSCPSKADKVGQDIPRINGTWFTDGSHNPYAYNYVGQCTWYVFGRCGLAGWTLDMSGTYGNAEVYYGRIKNSSRKDYTPGVGAVMCFSGSDVGGVGHVAYVDQVIDDNTWVIDHYNWGKNLAYYVSTVRRDPKSADWVNLEGKRIHFTGFVHSPNESSGGGGNNPSPADIRTKLIVAGQKWQIPPHILFGIAWQESGWRQFDENGNTVISSDGGIGIMQLTGATAAQFDVDRLRTDVDYNIDAGAKVLNDKWNATPIIGDNDRAKLENWYYAIWAYNSFGSVNNPNYNSNSYQHKVISIIANCPNGQWQNCQVTEPALSLIGIPPGRITYTPTPIHVDANYDGIIDGTDTTPPVVTITSGQISGSTYNSPQHVTWHIDDGGGSGIDRWGQGWDSDPGANPFTTSDGYLDLPVGTHTLHVHVRDKAGNEKDWTFGPYTYTQPLQVGQGSGGNIDQRYVDCYNRVGPSIVGNVNSYVHIAVGSLGNGGAEDFVNGTSGQGIIMAKDGAAQAFNTRGSIWQAYSAMNYASGPLGFPTSDEQDGAPSPQGTTGRVSHFEAGVITSTRSGTYEVHGDIFVKYVTTGASGGVLGFPNGNTNVNPGSVGRYGTSGNMQIFEGGGIFSSHFGTFEIHGTTWSQYALKIITGIFGFPTSDEQSATPSPQGTTGSVVHFENGVVCNTVRYGVHGVYGTIFRKYAAAAGSGGTYGFPISDHYDWQGVIRQDFEGGYLTTGADAAHTHILWNSPDGRAVIWDSNADGSYSNHGQYGPYTDAGGTWRATTVATGPNGVSRLLWTNPDGRAVLWYVNPDGTHGDGGQYGPYTNAGGTWRAITIAVGPDNMAHILWSNPDGRSVLWDGNADGTYGNHGQYGPYADSGGTWRATAVSVSPDDTPHILWSNPDGRSVLWDGNADGTYSDYGQYGPYVDSGGVWKAITVSVGPDALPHLLWDNPSGRSVLWDGHPDGTYGDHGQHGPYTDAGGTWQAVTVSIGPDNMPHLLWDNPDGRSVLWNGNADGTYSDHGQYGPYTDAGGTWRAVAVSTGP